MERRSTASDDPGSASARCAAGLGKKLTQMRVHRCAAIVVGVVAAAIVGFTAPVVAGATGNAQDTVNSLQAQGYNVQLNGGETSTLSECAVAGVHGLDSVDSAGSRVHPRQFTTVYVDISCPPTV
jgi:hypothetical protein